MSLICRILLFSSVAFNDMNTITVEFNTPAFVSPDSMLFCFTDLTFQFGTQQGFSLQSLLQGGDIFTQTQQELLTPYSQFLGSSLHPDALDGMEYGSISDVLGSDRYYGGSYTAQR